MKRTSLILLLLSLVGLVVVYLLQEAPKEKEATFVMPASQLSINFGRIVRVDISRANSFVRLEKVRGEWRVTEPVYASPDPAKLDNMLEGIKKFRLNGMVSSNPEKQNLFHVDDNGTNVLFVNDDGSTVSLIVGKAAPTPGTGFVRMPLSDTVYIAQGLTPETFNHDLRGWRQRGVYEVSQDSLFAFSVSGSGGRADVRRSDKGWIARGEVLPADVVNPVLAIVTNVQAESFIDSSVVISTRPRYQVNVEGMKPVRMEFYPPMGSDTNYILKTSGSATLALIRPSIAREFQRFLAYTAPVETPTMTESSPAPVVQQPPAEKPKPQQQVTAPPVQQQTPPQTSPATSGSTTPTGRPKRPARSRSVQEQPAQKTVVDEGELTVHTVKRGETINAIAKKYDVTVEQLRKWNGLQNDNVVPGMEMYVFVKKK